MTKVFSAHAVSVDGFISGPGEGVGHGLGDAKQLFDWYFNGDTPSREFRGFRLSEASAPVFDALASRVGANVAGRTTYEHSSHFSSGNPHPTAPLVVLSHRLSDDIVTDRQTLITTGIEDAIDTARQAAGDQDIAIMGGGAATAALDAGLVDEVILHQVPVLLGSGRPFFGKLSRHVNLALRDAVVAPGVTHLHYDVVR